MLCRPVTPGDLAWLWSKIQPRGDSKTALSRVYVEPEARDDDLQAQVAALFVRYPIEEG